MISIVDDDDAVREMLVSLTRSLGYDATGFASAEELLASAALDTFSCVITDIHMPGMSGFELQEQLRQCDEPIPIIMITARTEPDLERRAISGGAIGLLRKPLDIEMLVSFIEKALGS
ncbi:response regulator [Bradyrhizobium sp. CIAT3101]|uniref:response regulator transcription factor n=1 Tax=Bradyrhizobium sp. CIAT3101 TaxID=439387 RepID=UPI0024B10FCE|nr:response regulator [Bradyrhizobium sp. CIAT3101]WFU84410.1 response regulator [Bradyrhizobium sp. CIAT3101]